MKFYKSGLESVVWNPAKDAPLAVFEKPDFTFETDDPEVIAKLKELGYQEIPDDGVGENGGPKVTTRLRS